MSANVTKSILGGINGHLNLFDVADERPRVRRTPSHLDVQYADGWHTWELNCSAGGQYGSFGAVPPAMRHVQNKRHCGECGEWGLLGARAQPQRFATDLSPICPRSRPRWRGDQRRPIYRWLDKFRWHALSDITEVAAFHHQCDQNCRLHQGKIHHSATNPCFAQWTLFHH